LTKYQLIELSLKFTNLSKRCVASVAHIIVLGESEFKMLRVRNAGRTSLRHVLRRLRQILLLLGDDGVLFNNFGLRSRSSRLSGSSTRVGSGDSGSVRLVPFVAMNRSPLGDLDNIIDTDVGSLQLCKATDVGAPARDLDHSGSAFASSKRRGDARKGRDEIGELQANSRNQGRIGHVPDDSSYDSIDTGPQRGGGRADLSGDSITNFQTLNGSGLVSMGQGSFTGWHRGGLSGTEEVRATGHRKQRNKGGGSKSEMKEIKL
jgi:hypothetical protein